MAGTTLLQGFPYPSTTDAALGPAAFQNLGVAVEKQVVMVFASAAARTAAFTAAGISPAAGMLCYRADAPGSNKMETWNTTAGAWRLQGDYKDSQTLGSTAATVTFSNIPSYLKVIELSITARGDYAGGDYAGIQLQVAGVTTALYRNFNRFSSDTITFDANSPNIVSSWLVSYMPTSTAFGGVYSAASWKAVGWDSPHTGCLSMQSSGGTYDGTAGTNLSNINQGNLAANGPYTTLTLFPAAGNFVSGSQFTLKGYDA